MAEINNREWSGFSSETMPSGSEVHSAAFVVAVPVEYSSVTSCSAKPSLRDRVEDLKSKGMQKVNTLKTEGMQRVNTLKSDGVRRMNTLKSTSSTAVTEYRTKLNDNVLLMRAKAKIRMAALQRDAKLRSAQIQQGMKTDTAKWAGVASGTGLALGLLGRVMRHRAKHRREMMTPQVVIIQASC
jgi:hypothetical protein